jgi:hypothetical protein
MALVSISEAAKLVRRNRTTLYRDIEKGRLSKTVSPEGDARIDTSELLRVYGRLHAGEDDAVVGTNASDMIRIALLEEKNRSLERALALEAELRRVKDQVTAELRARITDKETTIRMLESRLFLLEREAGPHRLPPALGPAATTLPTSDATDRPAPARAKPAEVSDARGPAPVQAETNVEANADAGAGVTALAASVQPRPIELPPLQAQPGQQPPVQQPAASPHAMPVPPMQSPPSQKPIAAQPPAQQPLAQSPPLQHAVHVPVTPARPPAEKRTPPGRKGWLARLLHKKS